MFLALTANLGILAKEEVSRKEKNIFVKIALDNFMIYTGKNFL